jgi:hypothetical protein
MAPPAGVRRTRQTGEQLMAYRPAAVMRTLGVYKINALRQGCREHTDLRSYHQRPADKQWTHLDDRPTNTAGFNTDSNKINLWWTPKPLDLHD